MKTIHSIDVACHADEAFAMGLRVDAWPDIFPPCLAARVLDETETEQVIALTARANDTVLSWESTRRLDRAARSISFVQSKPSPLLSSMAGAWSFTPLETGCRIDLSHEFEIAEAVAGLVGGVETRADAERFMADAVETNSHRELAAMAGALERAHWRGEFEESLLIRAPLALIHRLLREASEWPSLLPHCEGVDVTYDDGVFQEFVMIVKVGEMREEIRSIRVLSDTEISYFQPTPPPALVEHRGRWTLRETADGVAVTSWHDVVLAPAFWGETPPADALAKVADAINRNSMGTMKAIAAKLGGSADA